MNKIGIAIKFCKCYVINKTQLKIKFNFFYWVGPGLIYLALDRIWSGWNHAPLFTWIVELNAKSCFPRNCYFFKKNLHGSLIYNKLCFGVTCTLHLISNNKQHCRLLSRQLWTSLVALKTVVNLWLPGNQISQP
jgi:hypothetical protein